MQQPARRSKRKHGENVFAALHHAPIQKTRPDIAEWVSECSVASRSPHPSHPSKRQRVLKGNTITAMDTVEQDNQGRRLRPRSKSPTKQMHSIPENVAAARSRPLQRQMQSVPDNVAEASKMMLDLSVAFLPTPSISSSSLTGRSSPTHRSRSESPRKPAVTREDQLSSFTPSADFADLDQAQRYNVHIPESLLSLVKRFEVSLPSHACRRLTYLASLLLLLTSPFRSTNSIKLSSISQ